MDDLSTYLKSVTKISLFFLSFCFLCWAALPQYKAVIGGLVIGVIASVINYQHLGWKVQRITGMVDNPRSRKTGTGFLTRGSIAVLAVVISQRFDYEIFAAIPGLFFTQLVTLVLGIFSTVRMNK